MVLRFFVYIIISGMSFQMQFRKLEELYQYLLPCLLQAGTEDIM